MSSQTFLWNGTVFLEERDHKLTHLGEPNLSALLLSRVPHTLHDLANSRNRRVMRPEVLYNIAEGFMMALIELHSRAEVLGVTNPGLILQLSLPSVDQV